MRTPPSAFVAYTQKVRKGPIEEGIREGCRPEYASCLGGNGVNAQLSDLSCAHRALLGSPPSTPFPISFHAKSVQDRRPREPGPGRCRVSERALSSPTPQRNTPPLPSDHRRAWLPSPARSWWVRSHLLGWACARCPIPAGLARVRPRSHVLWSLGPADAGGR
ncbi:hypothetical protein GQ53DRAFT_337883 [Thozetella sp. PMI_491]|nr:hypothetical protein GQ53DRAFT_337883 [Thozetella sp. PMI_491]